MTTTDPARTVPAFRFDADWSERTRAYTDGVVIPNVVVDSRDRVYVHRRAHPAVVVYDREGNLLATWGEQFEKGAHGLLIRRESDGEYLYFVDTVRHVVEKCDTDGRTVWVLGEPGRIGGWGEPFNRPTDIAFTPEGDFYVSDGYGNAHVHHYDPDRRLIRTWGAKGTGPGEFSISHDAWFDARGGRRRVWTCDRENNRLQIFSPEGEFLEEKSGFRRPNGLWEDPRGYLYLAELTGRLTIFDPADRVVSQIGEFTREPGDMRKPHAVWGDSRGDIYVAEVEDGARIQKLLRI